jgi:hypothetical protein
MLRCNNKSRWTAADSVVSGEGRHGTFCLDYLIRRLSSASSLDSKNTVAVIPAARSAVNQVKGSE